jgi:molybdopterin-guanine dinucleotide biosynthesis protein A
MSPSDSNSIDPKQITCIVLSGGRGSRMGGVDKGLQPFMGSSLVLHAVQRLRSQVSKVMISANRNFSTYLSFCDEVWPDTKGEFEGPLAGFRVGLEHTQTQFLLTAPCDCPHLPLDLAARLGQGLLHHNAQLAMARATDLGLLRVQPVFSLMRANVLPSLVEFMEHGGRKIEDWSLTLKSVMVNFDQTTDDPLAFSNINTQEQLKALESALHLSKAKDQGTI